MSAKQSPRSVKLDSLRLQLAGDALSLSDVDIAEDIKAAGLDPADVATGMRTITMEMVAQTRRRQLERSRAKLERAPTETGISRSIEAVRQKIADLAKLPQSLAGKKVALAFRKGGKQSDEDLLSLWQDLVDLGVVSDQDLEH